ncbi:transmembrane protein, putative (macronuclear) [Tetrahymena thermophila SB210]|uniref:Transmembrane protein, putative n=1 Tax=Tetrahymena thermophila (strain SB210) TaxID=312017 RepID=W7XIJ3_TETTS|nr:transmembrane protein, putative [Tetrahymena thermophila SB210]EWS74701.1 transmembrane protein, putative [Tetrahymena thermophila SB210]|eukprot:XP_012652702.1 transmembrane protein, putative [Tetrahymena thermophila SB210]
MMLTNITKIGIVIDLILLKQSLQEHSRLRSIKEQYLSWYKFRQKKLSKLIYMKIGLNIIIKMYQKEISILQSYLFLLFYFFTSIIINITRIANKNKKQGSIEQRITLANPMLYKLGLIWISKQSIEIIYEFRGSTNDIEASLIELKISILVNPLEV